MKSKIALSVFLLFIIVSFTRLLPKGSAESPQTQSPQQEVPTPVQRGKMTEMQREHSKLFGAYGSGKKISDLASAEGEIEIRIAPSMSGGLPDSPIMTLNQMLRHDACRADAIVTGTFREKSSQLTENEEFIFTDYEFTVDEVLKQNRSSQILGNSDITISGPGGAVLFRGKRIRAIDSTLIPFTVGQRYLIFLKYVSTTDSYREIETGGSYRLIGNDVNKNSEATLGGLEIQSAARPFISEVRSAAAGPCDPGEAK